MSDYKPHVFFHVQHLLGIGHVQRASALAQSLVKHGFDVTVANGGEALPGAVFAGAELLQLPAVKSADAQFSGLVDSAGVPIDDAFKARRRQILIDTFTERPVDILLIENYPFGRRQLRWEYQPLLDHVKTSSSNPLVVCSIRDILQQRSEKRELETAAILEKYFDCILVHGDEAFLPLENSYSLTSSIRTKIQYTGFVSTSEQVENAHQQDGVDEVIVSSGGGAVGFALMGLALEARKQEFLSDTIWRFLIGPNMPESDQHRLRKGIPRDCIVESARHDFRSLLSHCRLSVSQAGYNTVLDLIHAECPAMLIPFEAGGETEQRMRAEKLQAIGRCTYLSESQMTVDNFVRQAEQALSSNTSKPTGFDLQGGQRSAEILKRRWQERMNYEVEH